MESEYLAAVGEQALGVAVFECLLDHGCALRAVTVVAGLGFLALEVFAEAAETKCGLHHF